MKIKLYTFYSDSHIQIYNDFFLKTFYECGLDKNFELDATKVIQRSNTGDFNSNGFKESMADKVHILKRAIHENPTIPFVYSDCDVQFFKNPFSDLMKYVRDDIDMVAQNDIGGICAGFFMANPTEKFKEFLDVVDTHNHEYSNDQLCMNTYRDMIRLTLLPKHKYFTIGNYYGLWNGESINLNNEIFKTEMILHHANFTIGVENKILMFDMIAKQINN